MFVKVFMCAFWLIAGQVTQHNKWHAWSGYTCLKFAFFSNVCHLFPPMLEVLFSFLVHTISGGLSRVASAMSTSPNRSRSPLRHTGDNPDGKAEGPKENPVVGQDNTCP